MDFNQSHSAQQLKLHFKQWSNKGYAAFCSVGKVVHISNLTVAVTQWIGNLVELVETTLQVSLDKEVDECAEVLIEKENLQVLPLVVSTDVECGLSKLIRNNINCR